MARAPAPSASISAKGSFWAPSRTRPLEPTQIAADFTTTGSSAAASPPVMGSLTLPRVTRFETTTRFTGSPPEVPPACLTTIHQYGSSSPFQRNSTKFRQIVGKKTSAHTSEQVKCLLNATFVRRTRIRSPSGPSFAINETRKPRAHVARFVKMTGHALRAPAHGEGESTQIRHDRKHRFIGDVIADENRTAAAERLVAHQFANARCLVKAGLLDFADAFSRQDFDRRIRQIGPDQGHRRVNRLLRMRRQPVVKRQRINLVFQQNAGAELGYGGKR